MELNLWFAFTLGIAGLLIGSFLNVVAIRGLQKASIVYPASHCVHCQHTLRPFDLIPVVSYFFLRGRCRYCGESISPVYPIGEAAAAVVFAWIGWHYGPLNLEWIPALLLASVLIVITHTDLKEMTIPNAIVFPAAAIAAILRGMIHPLPYWNYVAAAAIGFGILYILAVLSRGGMGGGDMKLYLFIGLICGIPMTLLSLFFASLLGSLYGLGRQAFGRGKRKEAIPFGPFIACGTLPAFLYGNQIIALYLQFFYM